jgi:hypothetical protein
MPPGKYALTVESKGFTSGHSFYVVEVPAHGCGVGNVGMFTNGTFSGTVTERDGTPVRGVSVEYLYKGRKVINPPFQDRATKTDEQGRFQFSKVPPGEFIVGVHIDTAPVADERIPPTYWPGVTDIKFAKVLRLGVNQKRNGLVIRLGPRARVRKITVRVEWPDGRSASGTSVRASVRGLMTESSTTDATGRAEFSILVGIEYSFTGRNWTSYRIVNGNKLGDDWVDAEAQTLSPSSSTNELVLLLNKPRQRRP